MCARKISESADYPMVENVLDEKLLNRSKPTEEHTQVTSEAIITEKDAIENRKLPEIPVARDGRSRERLNYPRIPTLRGKVSRRRCRSNDVQPLRKGFEKFSFSDWSHNRVQSKCENFEIPPKSRKQPVLEIRFRFFNGAFG